MNEDMGEIKNKVVSSVFVTVSAIALITVFCSVLEFTVFVSLPNFYTPAKVVQNADSDAFWSKVFWGLFINSSLLSLFILQHSVMALPAFKKVFSSLGLDVIERNVYVILTSLALQMLVRNWQPIPEIAFWRFVPNRFTWWLLILVHSFLWILIYVGNICADVNELLGIRQVYYYIKNLPQPQQYKSAELVRLNNHMRHPSFLAFVFLFWITATMSLDRVLLATILSSYMYITWRTDNSDYRYVEIQYRRKFHELQRL